MNRNGAFGRLPRECPSLQTFDLRLERLECPLCASPAGLPGFDLDTPGPPVLRHSRHGCCSCSGRVACPCPISRRGAIVGRAISAVSIFFAGFERYHSRDASPLRSVSTPQRDREDVQRARAHQQVWCQPESCQPAGKKFLRSEPPDRRRQGPPGRTARMRCALIPAKLDS